MVLNLGVLGAASWETCPSSLPELHCITAVCLAMGPMGWHLGPALAHPCSQGSAWCPGLGLPVAAHPPNCPAPGGGMAPADEALPCPPRCEVGSSTFTKHPASWQTHFFPKVQYVGAKAFWKDKKADSSTLAATFFSCQAGWAAVLMVKGPRICVNKNEKLTWPKVKLGSCTLWSSAGTGALTLEGA